MNILLGFKKYHYKSILLIAVSLMIVVLCTACESGGQSSSKGGSALSSSEEVGSDDASSASEFESSQAVSDYSGDPSSQTSTSKNASSNQVSSASQDTSKAPDSKDDILAGRDVFKLPWNLVLANKWHPIPQNQVPELTGIAKTDDGGYYQFDTRAVVNYNAMMSAAKSAGMNLWISSSYRSYETQQRLYNNQVQQQKNNGHSQAEAEAVAATIVAKPGTSEHNSGLAVDFNGVKNSFKDTKEYKWLQEHCAEYGFILRFPSDKSNITAVIYEPWHYRYVGKEHAQIIMQKKICLEEYLRDYILK